MTNGGRVHWGLVEEVHEWLMARQSRYLLEVRYVNDDGSLMFNYRWTVGVDDPDVALLLKLTWA